MRLSHIIVRATALIAFCGVAGCNSADVTGTGSSKPGIQLLSSSSLTDTVTAQIGTPLAVVVRGTDGAPRSGAVVRFEANSLDEANRKGPWAVLCTEGVTPCGLVGTTSLTGRTSVTDTTDAQGRAAVSVRLGTFTGTSFVRVTVPELSVADSMAIDVRVGAATRVIFAARDTSVSPGGRVSVDAFAVDRFSNTRADAVNLVSNCGSIADVDVAGRIVTGRGFGVCYVRAASGSFSDSARVIIVPAGRLLTWSTTPLLLLVNTDGTAPHTLFNGTAFRSDLGVFPRFGQTRSSVILHLAQNQAGQPQMLARGDTSAASATIFGTNVTEPAYGRELADGTILFVGRNAAGGGHSVWRTTVSGTPAEVRAIPDYAATYGAADISPDGTRIVYVGGVAGGANVIRVMTLATGAVTEMNVAGEAPRWAPAGDQIAYLAGNLAQNVRGPLSVVRVADRVSRAVTDRVVLPGFAWSPDAAYLVAGTDAGTIIIRTADGVVVPTRILSSPFAREFDWR